MGGVIVSTEMGYVIAFVIFIVLMFVRPGGIFAKRAMRPRAASWGSSPLVPGADPVPAPRRACAGVRLARHHPDLHLVLHRQGVVADGPLRPRLARPRRVPRRRRLRDRAPLELLRHDPVDRRRSSRSLLTVALAVVIGLSRARASRWSATTSRLVTLAVGEVIRLLIIAERDWTGGSLGVSLKTGGHRVRPVDAPVRRQARLLLRRAWPLWLVGLWVWWRVDRSMARSAMEAIGEDETAAASVGIRVTRFKIGITALSAALTALGGVAARAVPRLREPGHALRHRRVAAHRLRGGAGRHVLAARARRWAPR